MGKHGDAHRRLDGKLTLFENNDGMPSVVNVNCTYVYGPHNVPTNHHFPYGKTKSKRKI